MNKSEVCKSYRVQDCDRCEYCKNVVIDYRKNRGICLLVSDDVHKEYVHHYGICDDYERYEPEENKD